MTQTAPTILGMARGNTDIANVDCGENTDGQETGFLADGDTVVSATVSVIEKPTSDAVALVLGAVTVGSANNWICGRQCGSGEWVKFRVTAASDQVYGLYKIKIAAVTTQGNTINKAIWIRVEAL